MHIADHRLEVVKKVKLLGVTIQCDLKWDSQNGNILKKANQKMFMLRKLKAAGLNIEELLVAYKGYMRPLLEYAAPCGTQVSPQNRLTRLRTYRSEFASTSLAGITYHIMNLEPHWTWNLSMTDVLTCVLNLPRKHLLLIGSQSGSPPCVQLFHATQEKVCCQTLQVQYR